MPTMLASLVQLLTVEFSQAHSMEWSPSPTPPLGALLTTAVVRATLSAEGAPGLVKLMEHGVL